MFLGKLTTYSLVYINISYQVNRLLLRNLLVVLQKRGFAELRKLPDYLLNIPETINPQFYDMVQYYFHSARIIVEDKLIEGLTKDSPLMTRKERMIKVQNIMKYIEKLDCVLEVSLPFQKDNGEFRLLKCYKVQHKGYCLPLIGGLRYCKRVTLDQVRALAKIMTYKCACAGLPHGGSKAGIAIDPKQYSVRELERITRSYTHKMVAYGLIGPAVDVPGPDVGTGEREMAWIGDSYRKAFGAHIVGSKGCVTGRTKAQGGILKNLNPSGCAIFYCLSDILNNEEIMAKLNVKCGVEGKTFITQGFGKVGASTATILAEAGAKCIGVQGKDTALINSSGIDCRDLAEYKLNHGTISGYAHASTYTGEDLICEPCDILLLAATEMSVKFSSAENIKAKIIIEGSNGPITPASEKVIREKNILIIPDIIANVGTIMLAYIELLNDLETYTLGKFTFRYTGDCYLHFLRSVQESLGRQELRSFKDIRIAPSVDFMRRIANAREDEIILSSIASSINTSIRRTMATAREFDLGLDLRTACYVNAIQKIFWEINEAKFSW